MEIQTRFQIDETIVFMHNMKIVAKSINQINVTVRNQTKEVQYFVNVGTDDKYESKIINESDAFESDEELLKFYSIIMREIMIRRIMLKLDGVPQLDKQRIATDIFDDFEAAYPEIRKPIPTNYE